MPSYNVAPFTGAWIEIILSIFEERLNKVAPFTGAWIEISNPNLHLVLKLSRSLHGGVD